MAVAQIAQDLADLCRKGHFMEAIEKHYGTNVVSVEPVDFPGMPAEMSGIEAVKGKNRWWSENHDVHDIRVDGPFVGDKQFALRFYMDVSPKSGGRVQMTEMALYTVENDKIVKEEFYYNAQNSGA